MIESESHISVVLPHGERGSACTCLMHLAPTIVGVYLVG